MKGPLTLALAALLSTAAFAQTPPSGAGSVFDQFDSDHDGRITQTEAQINSTVVANFQTADSNADGSLSKGEFDAAFKPSSSPTADKPQSEQAPAPNESPRDMPPADQTTPPSDQPPR